LTKLTISRIDVANRDPICVPRTVGKDVVVTPVVITHREGVKNVRVTKVKEEEKVQDGVNMVTVEVKVGKRKKKNKLKKNMEGAVEGEVKKKVEK